MRFYLLIPALLLVLAACRPETYTPKPRGYFEVALPKRGYQSFNDPAFPYSFEYPVYGNIVRDTSFFGQTPENPYWINIDIPSLGGRIYISYKAITAAQPLNKVIEDTYEMTMYHTKRADNIEDMVYHNNDAHVHGVLYNVTGNAASAYQFYLTDSLHHYLRGALYFDVPPNADSLKPVNDFLYGDVKHLVETFRWK
ncbi:MAG: hypothetical protein EOP51_19035 [Sphingobacteriales bacterium]|nr:MAG: hypothetical protein EOP51_19035 [Sphingobacteriales bacterium]